MELNTFKPGTNRARDKNKWIGLNNTCAYPHCDWYYEAKRDDEQERRQRQRSNLIKHLDKHKAEENRIESGKKKDPKMCQNDRCLYKPNAHGNEGTQRENMKKHEPICPYRAGQNSRSTSPDGNQPSRSRQVIPSVSQGSTQAQVERTTSYQAEGSSSGQRASDNPREAKKYYCPFERCGNWFNNPIAASNHAQNCVYQPPRRSN